MYDLLSIHYSNRFYIRCRTLPDIAAATCCDCLDFTSGGIYMYLTDEFRDSVA